MRVEVERGVNQKYQETEICPSLRTEHMNDNVEQVNAVGALGL